MVRLFGYFTILSNGLIAYAHVDPRPRPRSRHPGWRLLRLDGLIGITVTFVVVQVLLKGLVELDGADLLADNLLHVVVPVLAVIGWLVLRPP